MDNVPNAEPPGNVPTSEKNLGPLKRSLLLARYARAWLRITRHDKGTTGAPSKARALWAAIKRSTGF